MERISIWRPRPEAAAPPNAATIQAESALAKARYRAKAAVEDADALLAGADARERSGTWQAPGAASLADYGALGAGEDIIARHQRKRQRR